MSIGKMNLSTSLLLILTACLFGVSLAYEVGKCYCYSDSDYEALEFYLDTTDSPPQHMYWGIYIETLEKKIHCPCSDVTLVRTILKVTDEEIVNDANLNATVPLAIKITNQRIDSLPATMATHKTALANRIASINIAGLVSVSDTRAQFAMDILLKGQDKSLSTVVGDAFTASTSLPIAGDNNKIIGIQYKSEVMTIDRDGMVYEVTECSADLADAPVNGKRIWNGGLLGGSIANYTCNEGYILANKTQSYTMCDHDEETWTFVNATCIPGCAEDIPNGPVFTVPDWFDKKRTEGTIVHYPCRKGYKSSDGTNATTLCKDGNWTDIIKTDDFGCEEIVCYMKDMPVLPAWAKLFWNGLQSDGTKATYDCIDGYKPFLGEADVVECKDSVWGQLTPGWKCVDNSVEIQSEILAREEKERQADEELDEQEKRDKALLEEEQNYILYITVPSMCVLMLIVACCACCTRVDSPLCSLFTARHSPKYTDI